MPYRARTSSISSLTWVVLASRGDGEEGTTRADGMVRGAGAVEGSTRGGLARDRFTTSREGEVARCLEGARRVAGLVARVAVSSGSAQLKVS